MTLAFSLVTDPPALVASDAVVAGVYEDRSLSAAAAERDRWTTSELLTVLGWPVAR